MDSTRLKVEYCIQAFPGRLVAGRCGVAGNVCWQLSENNEVISWNPDRGIASDEWRGLGDFRWLTGCALVTEPEQKKDTKRVHLITEEDGFALAVETKLYWKLPTSIATAGKSFDLLSLGCLDEGEVCTAIAGDVKRKKSHSTILLGTSRGRVVRLSLTDFRGEPDFEDIYQAPEATQDGGVLVRFFTPRKSKPVHNAIAAIAKCQGSEYVIVCKQGELATVDAENATELSSAKLPSGYEGLAISCSIRNAARSVLVQILAKASGSEFRLLECELENLGRFEEVREARYQSSVEISSGCSPLSLIQTAQTTLISACDVHGVLQKVILRGGYTWGLTGAVQESSIMAVGTFLSATPQLLFLMEAGQVASTERLSRDATPGLAIPQDRVERLVRTLLALSLESSTGHLKSDFSRTAAELRSRDEYNELKCGNPKVKAVAVRCLGEALRAKLCPVAALSPVETKAAQDDFENKLQEKSFLVKLALLIRQDLGMDDVSTTGASLNSFSGHDDDDEQQQGQVDTALQTTGEKLYAAIELISHELETVRKEFSSEGAFLSNVDNVKVLIDKLSTGASDAGTVERRLNAINSAFTGANRFALLCGNDKNSNLARLMRSQILSALIQSSTYFQGHSVQRSVGDLVKKFQSLTLVAYRANPTNRDAFDALVRLADAKDAMLRDLALAALKSLAEETREFKILVEACYKSPIEDLATLEKGLRMSISDDTWHGFPSTLFQYLVHTQKPRKAFELVDLVNVPGLLEELNAVLDKEKGQFPEVAALGRMKSKEYTKAAQTLQQALQGHPHQIQTKRYQTIEKMGMLCAFAAGDSDPFQTFRSTNDH